MESAAGSAKNGRDKQTQAIYSLKGKPLNAERVRIDKMYDNKEMSDLIHVIGTGIGEDFDMSKLKYHKIIIMSDADVDGSHIGTLLEGFFFRQMRPLVEAGMIYLASPPLFRIVEGKDSVSYIRDGSKLNAYLAKRFLEKGKMYVKKKELLLPNGTLAGFLKEAEIYSKKITLLASAMGCPTSFIATIVESCEAEDAKTLKQAIASELELAEIRGATVLGSHTESNSFVSAVVTEAEVPLFISAQKAAMKAAEKIEGIDVPVRITYNGREDKVGTVLGLSESVNRMTRQGINIGYLKGLGEANADQLWDTTMDPAKRTLIRLKVADFDDAGEMITLLLGKKAEPRRAFMTENVDRYPREMLDI